MFHSASLQIPRLAIFPVLIFLLISSGPIGAQSNQPATTDVAAFFKSIAGEWVGICEQSTNGEKADNKYFHVIINEVSPGRFDSRFEYYRCDKSTDVPQKIGESVVVTTIAPDGSAECKINGKGTVLVNDQPRSQEHELLEALSSAAAGGLRGEGSGKLSVFGMPLGVGKNGKVQESQSCWNLTDNVLSITQKISVGFRALFINRTYDIEAKYTARRGSDMASLMNNITQASAKVPGKT